MDQHIEGLKLLHDYDVWSGRNTLGGNLFIKNFMLCGDEFSGWEALRILHQEQEEWPPYIKSIWQRSGEMLLGIDVYECNSLMAAHEFILRLLDEFMSPLIKRREDLGIGDVTFAMPEGYQIMFARANIVVQIANAGSDLVPVKEIALKMDEMLISRPGEDEPEEDGPGIVIRIPQSDLIEGQGELIACLAMEGLELPESRRGLKMFSRSGEVFRKGERIIYRAISAGSHEVDIFPINPGPAVVV